MIRLPIGGSASFVMIVPCCLARESMVEMVPTAMTVKGVSRARLGSRTSTWRRGCCGEARVWKVPVVSRVPAEAEGAPALVTP